MKSHKSLCLTKEPTSSLFDKDWMHNGSDIILGVITEKIPVTTAGKTASLGAKSKNN